MRKGRGFSNLLHFLYFYVFYLLLALCLHDLLHPLSLYHHSYGRWLSETSLPSSPPTHGRSPSSPSSPSLISSSQSLTSPLALSSATLFFFFPSVEAVTDGTYLSHEEIANPDDEKDDMFGCSVAYLGDIDGDLISDIAVGACRDEGTSGGTAQGAVWIMLLNEDGSSRAFTKAVSDTPTDNEWFGSAITPLGEDTNGDGVQDFLVSSARHGSKKGRIWLVQPVYQTDSAQHPNYDSNSAAPVSPASASFDGDLHYDITVLSQGDLEGSMATGDYCGMSMAHIFDLDGDGMNDVVVGCPQADVLYVDSSLTDDDVLLNVNTDVDLTTAATGPGFFFVVFLNSDGTVKKFRKTYNRDMGYTLATGDAFAHSVAYLSPTSSAHRSTHRRMTTTILAIGAPGTSDGGTHTHGGAVYMVFIDIDGDIETYHQLDAAGTYFGSGSNEAGLTADEGSMYTLRSYDRFGSSVVGVRDVNEDGYTDIVIGAALADEYDDSDVLHAENTGTAILVLLDADAKVTTHTMFNNYKLGEVEAGSLLGTQLAYLDSYFAPAETAMTRVMVGAPFDDDDDPANEGGSVFIATLHTSLTPSIELREVVSLQFEEVGYGYIITQTFTIHFDNYQHTEPAAFSISTDMDTRPFVAHSHDVSIFNLDVTNSLYDDARVEYVSGSGTIIQSPLDDTGSGAATITEAGDAYSISLSHLPRDAVLSFSAACKLTTHVSYKEELTGTLTLTYDTDTVVGGGVGSHYGTSAVTEALDSVITLNYTTNHAPVLASTETNFAFVEGQSVYLDTISVSDIDFNLLNRSSLMQFEINVTNGGAVGLTYVDAVYIEEVTGTDKFDFSYCKFRCRLDVANLALPSLQYTGDVVIGDVEVQISVSDEGNCGKGGPKMDSISVNVSTSDANTAPTIGGVLLVEIDEEETILFTGPNAITVADEDAGTNDIILTATATYGTLQHTHDGATDPAIDAVCVITADDQVATITGDVTAINAFVEYLQFTPLQDLNMLSTGEDFVYFVINDQGHANSGAVKTFLEDAMTTVIQIAAVNDAPVCGVPSSPVTAAEGTYRTISDVTVDDVDVTETFGGYMQASVTATLGTVTLSSKVGLYITTGDGDDDANVVMQGSVNSIKAALEDMQYLPPSDYDGNDVIAISLSDLGNTGSGGTLTADCSITVSVSSVNDAAVLTAPTVIYGTESATTLITGVSFVDSDLDDSAEIDATVSVNIGTLFVTTGLATTYADDIVINADENEIVFTANKATLNTLLGGINVESPESFNGPGTEVSITIDDKAGGVTTAIVYVNLVSVNGAPIITSATPYSCNEDEWLTLTGLEIDDPDIGESFTAVLKATITVTGGSVKLAPDANGGYPFYFIQGGPGGDGIGASSYSTIEFEGSLARAKVAIEGMSFISTPNFYGNGNINIEITDNGFTGSGGAQTSDHDITMTIAAQPDPLSLTARPMLIDTGIYEDVLGDIDFGSLTDVDSIGTTVVTVDIYTMHGAASLDSSHAVAGSITESSVALAGIEVEKGGSKVRLVGTFADLATAFDDALKYQTEADWNILCCGSDTAKITTSFISPIDGSTQTSSYSINIAPLAVNDVPVITNTAAGGQLECDEDSSDLTLSAIEVADTDIGEGFATMLRATFSADQGTFSCDDTCKASGMYYLDSENTDASTLTFRAGVDVLPVLFAQIRYSPNSDYAGNDDLTVTIDDLGNTGALQNGQTASQTYTIVVNPVNDGLIMSLPAAATGGALPRWTLSEDVSETLSIALTDIDNTMDDITVVFQCTHCAAISVTSTLPTTTNAPPTGDSQSVSLTLSDNAVSTDTLTVTYLSASNWNSVFKGLDKIAITLTDAAGAGTLYTIEVLVDAVDDAPVIVNPFSASGVTLDEDVPYYFEGMSIADVESDDILDDLLTVVLEVDNGILSLNSSVGMYITSGGNSQSTITFKGTVSNINNAIDGLSYLSSTDYSGADQLDITVSDGTTDVTSAIVLTVNAINDPPELGIPSSLQTNEGATESLAWTVSDTDAYISVLTLVVECDESAGMTFDFAEVDNEVHVLDTSDAYILMSDTEAQYTTLITSITLQGTQDQLTKALDGFTYTNLDSVSKSSFIRMSLSDHGARGGGENYTVSATVPVYITHINDAPTVEFASAGSFDLYEDVTTVVAGMIVVDTDVDEDFNALIRLKLSVTGGATLSVEALYTEGLVVLDGAALTGVDTLEVRGALEYINVFIAKVQYTSAAHWTGADTLTVAVFDNGHSGTGGEGSNSYAYTINVLPVNDVIAVQAPLDSPYNAMPLLQVTEDVATHLDGLQLEDNEFVHTGDIATVTLEVSMLKGTVAYVIPATDPGNDLTSLGVSLSQTIAGDASTSTFVGTPSGVNFVCSNLHYTNSIDHDTSSDTLSVSISYAQSDGLGAGTITGSKDITLAVTAVNDSPVVSLPTDLQVTNGVASCLLGADISDADVPENDPDGNAYDTHAATYPYAYALYEATVSVLDGVIGLNTTAGLEIISEAGDEITIKGPLPYINRAIGKLHYTSPTSSYNDDTLTVTVSDAGYVSGAPFTSSSGDSTAPSSTTEAGIEVSSSCTINRTLAYDSITFNWPSAQTVMTVNEDTDLTIAVDIPSPSLTRTVAVHLYTTFGALSLANGDAGGNGNVAWASSTVAPAGWTASSDDSYTDLAVSGTMNAIAVELAGLVYHPVPDMNGVDYLTVVVDGVDTHILKIVVSAINDLPSLTYAGSSAASNNDGLSNLPLAGVSADEGATIALDLLVVTDVDADDTYGGVLTLQLDVAAGEVSFNESPYLSLPSFSSSSVSYGAYAFASPLDLNDPGVGPYDTDWTNRYQSFLYKGSLSAINVVLGTMQYHAPATQPPTGSDTLDISVNDNGNTGTGSSTTIDTALIPINSINNAPVITFDQSSLPPSMLMQMEEDNSYVLTSKLSVSDDAEGADALTMTITVKSGVGAVSLKASSLAALTFSTGDGTNDDSLVCDGTLTELNAALSELTFIPATHYYGISASAISVTVEDNGHATSAAGPASLSHTIAIGVQVLAVNDAPVITAPATASVQEASDFLFSSAGATTVSLVDVDADDDPEGLVRCTITSDNAAARVSVHSSVQALHFVSPSSVGGSWSTGIASQAAGRWPVFAALSFYGSAASVNAALHTLVVHTPSSSSGACPYDVDLTITVNDQGYSCGGADCATSVVDADGTDDGKLTAEHTITITVTCPV